MLKKVILIVNFICQTMLPEIGTEISLLITGRQKKLIYDSGNSKHELQADNSA